MTGERGQWGICDGCGEESRLRDGWCQECAYLMSLKPKREQRRHGDVYSDVERDYRKARGEG